MTHTHMNSDAQSYVRHASDHISWNALQCAANCYFKMACARRGPPTAGAVAEASHALIRALVHSM